MLSDECSVTSAPPPSADVLDKPTTWFHRDTFQLLQLAVKSARTRNSAFVTAGDLHHALNLVLPNSLKDILFETRPLPCRGNRAVESMLLSP